ncbi:CDP-diacylglycerol--glycerol-3-phosphate 3-phosphatidyltransferase [Rubritalea marina]|uniref:CDP-diacylglycerol--glycerol-3-phosphate 3-phosphatidyltransferase n=1 Tax=Rubritalea marina TaxID=361055 RepID=UPI00035D3E7E|nr:CDP-diacylglycerol--glycerol-3-phosphate 3-phosphatidyltransferase [Rubritalea marina]
MNIPNSITVFRLVLTAIFIGVVSIEASWAPVVALLTFVIAAISDWVDGYLARKLNLVTSLGKLLDPLADKILVAAGFIYLSVQGLCPVWLTCTIIGREFMVTGLRQIAVEQGKVIAADKLGKWKTTFQLTFVIGCLTHLTVAECPCDAMKPLIAIAEPSGIFIQTCLWLAAGLTIVSGYNYIAKNRDLLQQ